MDEEKIIEELNKELSGEDVVEEKVEETADEMAEKIKELKEEKVEVEEEIGFEEPKKEMPRATVTEPNRVFRGYDTTAKKDNAKAAIIILSLLLATALIWGCALGVKNLHQGLKLGILEQKVEDLQNNKNTVVGVKNSNSPLQLVTPENEDKDLNLSILSGNKSGTVMTADEIYEKYSESVVTIETDILVSNGYYEKTIGSGIGTGFFITEDGYLLTDAHVVENKEKPTAIMTDGTKYPIEIVGLDSSLDIALLKVNADRKFTPLVLGDFNKEKIGEDVVIMGNALGYLSNSIMKGIISGVNRPIAKGYDSVLTTFQVDAAINQGMSGGPVFNMKGEVIGLVSAKIVTTSAESLGFCVPINIALNILPDLLEYGEALHKPYMGVVIRNITSEDSKNLPTGVYVVSVENNMPGYYAGLQEGDVIVKFGGVAVTSVDELLAVRNKYTSGETVSVVIYRNGNYYETEITFATQSGSIEAPTTLVNPDEKNEEEIQPIPDKPEKDERGRYVKPDDKDNSEGEELNPDDFFNGDYGNWGEYNWDEISIEDIMEFFEKFK